MKASALFVLRNLQEVTRALKEKVSQKVRNELPKCLVKSEHWRYDFFKFNPNNEVLPDPVFENKLEL